MKGTAAAAAPPVSPLRFSPMTCAQKCAVTCNSNERLVSVMSMSEPDGSGFVLQDERRGTYHGPDKGMVKLMVICARR